MRRSLVSASMLVMILGLGVAPAAAGPAAGNGGKVVIPTVGATDIPCGGEMIHLDLDGWVQVNGFGSANNPNLEVSRFHSTYTYSNDDGDTWVFREVGLGHVYLDGEVLYVSVSGRSRVTPPLAEDSDGLIGRFVYNLVTGEVVLVGNEIGVVNDAACAALTSQQ